MKILAHRGLWKTNSEKNTLTVLEQALDEGYGIETDFRDYNGEIVISHNIADVNCDKACDLFQYYSSKQIDSCLALNVKADGIQEKMKCMLEKYNIRNYFFFDMSIPEMVIYKKMGLLFFTRHSDIENESVLYKDASGVWLDSFYTKDWLTEVIVQKHLSNNKRIGIISPEIHGFDHMGMWEILKSDDIYKRNDILLCTDIPEKAKEYFEL